MPISGLNINILIVFIRGVNGSVMEKREDCVTYDFY